ncbi:MAG: TerC family protein [Solirubrobacteraceae bacterium]
MAFEWGGLVAFVVLALAFDLRSGAKAAPSTRSALIWSVVWTGLGLLFAVVLLVIEDASHASDYLSGFLIEKSLSLDNLFVFAILFTFFGIPDSERQRVLVLGIAGAIVLRTGFILAGVALLDAFSWFTYVLGAILAITAYNVWKHGDEEMDPENTRIMKVVRRVTPEGTTNFVLALVAVAAFDVLFAIDSIPAIFAITRDTYVVFAANAFSLLGMVSLYFLLDTLLGRFRYLSQGLALILGYVALKLLLEDVVHPPEWLNLVVVVVTLTVAALLSKRREDADAEAGRAAPAPQTE